MNISAYFIDRPIFATVLSSIILLIGAICLTQLPVNEYPEVVPPNIQVVAQYPGASPTVIGDTVAGPLEQQMTGIPGLLYIESKSATNGTMTLSLTFQLGTHLEDALVEVQNRISQAQPKLPQEVRNLGITAKKSSGDIIMVVNLIAPAERYDVLYLSNYANLHVKDALAQVQGVGDVQVFGGGTYSMRIWLDPQRIAARNLNVSEVVAKVREQNVQVAAGILGAPPNAGQADYQLSISAHGRLLDETEFGNIIIKNDSQGRLTRLKDVAHLEMGADTYSLRSSLSGTPAVAIPIWQLPGSNSLDVSARVRATMERLKKSFPDSVGYRIVYDPTVFVRESISAVVETLLIALGLVVLVVVLFLQTWRASLIPLAAVPVSVIGTFAAMYMLGYTINALSLFGLVLAIGIVVDDAIVVVENVERNIALGLRPREATRIAMREVSGPIIATALVLCAVFIPTAFISGLTGQFYKQFAMTIAISTVISAVNSLTLSPALSAVLLKSHHAPKDLLSRIIDWCFGGFFRVFNRVFAAAAGGYVNGIRRVLRGVVVVLMIYVGLVILTGFGFKWVPTAFIPDQDKQFVIAITQLPEGASLDRTSAVVKRMSDIGIHQPGVADAVAFAGLSINGFVSSSNAGLVFLPLKPFAERKSPELSATGIQSAINQKFSSIQDGMVIAVTPPPILGLGQTGGFKVEIEDVDGLGLDQLNQVTQNIIAKARALRELNPYSVFTGFTMKVPEISVIVDREKVKQQNVDLSEVFATLSTYLGSTYANDFTRFGHTYQVNLQADERFRIHPEDIGKLKVRNASGAMVPLDTLITTVETSGPDLLTHYNTFPAAAISAAPAKGYSTDQARFALQAVIDHELPRGMAYEWTEITYQQILAGNTSFLIFPLCVLVVFLVLSAFYESWSLPLVILFIVPMCLLCAITGVWLSHGDDNIFTQIGCIVLVGLACKNAILIVEFAKDKEKLGATPLAAALEACRLRLRPILMTSIAFIVGVFPLVISTGAGSETRRALGVAVFSGMIGVTLFGLLLTPVFYVTARRLLKRNKADDHQDKQPPALAAQVKNDSADPEPELATTSF